MSIIFNTVEDLQGYIKINRSKDFETYRAYIVDAQDRYIKPYIGTQLLDRVAGTEDPLVEYIKRSLAPFSLAISMDEFSINFGESGHTVTRTDKLAPASDVKIEKARASLYERAWQNLDEALSFVQANISDYPEYEEVQRRQQTLLFDNAISLQEDGLLDINYSQLTYIKLRMLIKRIEQTETLRLLPSTMRTQFDKATASQGLLQAMQAYTASRVGALHTSITTRKQRAQPTDTVEFVPLIRPLFEEQEGSGNYFTEQAQFWANAIHEELVSTGVVSSDDGVVKFNTATKRIFVANAEEENEETTD